MARVTASCSSVPGRSDQPAAPPRILARVRHALHHRPVRTAGRQTSARTRASRLRRARELEILAAAVPPMTGAEYLTAAVLQSLWDALDAAFRVRVAGLEDIG